MATLAELFVLFKGDDSKLSADLDTAKGKVSGFASNATQLIGGAVAGAAVAAGAAILAIGKGAFDVSVDTQEAAGNMAASLGIPIEEAEKFAEVAKRVYGNNFADSIGDAATAVEGLAKQMGMSAEDPALQTMAENAFRLRDAFGVDVADSIDAVTTLTEQFGISNTKAFDLVAKGYQSGLDRSGDFLDTIGEYSTQFAAGGASANEFFALLESGSEGGMLGTDKAADAFKEFRIRIMEGTGEVGAWLDQMEGVVDSGIINQIRDGGVSAADAFELVVQGLQTIEDPVERHKAGIALMGTQYEDLGDQVVANMTLMGDWAETSDGAITKVDATYNSFGEAVTGVWRRLTVSVSPFTDKLLEIVNDAMPKVMAAFDAFDQNIGPIMEGASTAITTAVDWIKGLFSGFKGSVDENATGPLEYWRSWLDTNMPMIQTLFTNILGAIQGLWEIFGPAIEMIASTTFNNIWTLIDTIMRTIGDVITLALQILTGDWDGAWQTLEGIVTRVWDTIQGIVSNQLTLLRDLFLQIDWNAIGDAMMNGIRDGMKAAWDMLKDWFEGELERFRNMLPFSEPKDSRSPLRGLGKSGKALIENFRGGMEAGIDSLHASFGSGLAGIAGGFGSQPVARAGGMNIVVNVSGDNATYENGRAVGRGVLDELRRAGR